MLIASFSGFDPTETSIGAKQSPPLMLTPVNPRAVGRCLVPHLGTEHEAARFHHVSQRRQAVGTF
jgi:hypothetical protein